MIVRAALPIQTTNHWKRISIFLIVFIIASDAFFIFKLASQDNQLSRQSKEISQLLAVVTEYQKKENKEKKHTTAKEPELIKAPPTNETLVSLKEFNNFKKVYQREIRRLKRDIERLKKSAIRVK